jgi:hypothetical protein
MSMFSDPHKTSSNPWLHGYPVEDYSGGVSDASSFSGSPPPGGATAAAPPGVVGMGGGSSTASHWPPPTSKRWFWWLVVPPMVGGMALAATQVLLPFMIEEYKSDRNPQPSIVRPVDESDLFAIQIQVRSTMGEARRYQKRKNPNLMVALEHWNTSSGALYVHGELPVRKQVFIPEAREGREDAFDNLVLDGLGKIQLHAWPWVSENHLYKVATKCGLLGDGVEWIKQWSTWRAGQGQDQETKCRDGGWCILLSRSCQPDTFDEF